MFKLLKEKLKLTKELQEMKEERDYWQIRANVLDQQITERNIAYRQKVGEKEQIYEKAEFLDRCLTSKNKTLLAIQEIAENNDYGKPSMKVKKILELVRNQTNKS